MSATISSALSLSRSPVGSSAQTIAGSLTSARAIVTRWRSPPESSSGRCVGAVGEADEVRARRAPAGAPPAAGTRATSSGSSTFSTAVRTGMRL